MYGKAKNKGVKERSGGTAESGELNAADATDLEVLQGKGLRGEFPYVRKGKKLA